MEKLIFDSGVKEYELGSGVLRFNPSDPNVYARFMEAMDKLRAVEDSLVAKAREQITEETADQSGVIMIRLMAEADREVKDVLSYVFGQENDFDKILGGVNLLAVGSNGERVITNLIHALTPVIQEGAQKVAKQQAGAAVEKAKMNRAQRRAKKHGAKR